MFRIHSLRFRNGGLSPAFRSSIVFLIAVSIVAHSGTFLGEEKFAPAKFRNLTVGKSKGDAVRKSLRNPIESYRDDSKRTWLYYENIGPVPGKVEIVLSPKDVLEMVEVRPDQLTIDQAKKLFGKDFRLIRYDWDNCWGSGGEAPIFESANGPLTFIVYPKLGISFLASQNPVQGIDYRSTPLVSRRSRCPAAAK